MSPQLNLPRRVLLTTDVAGGTWTYSVEAAHGLASHGVSTVLAVPGPAPTRAQLAQAARVPGLELVAVPHPLDVHAASPDEVEAAALALAALAHERGADLVQVGHASLVSAGAFDAPLVVACHGCAATRWRAVRGSEPLPPDLAWRVTLASRALGRADVVIAPSASFAQATAQAYGLGRQPVVVRPGRRPAVRLGGEVGLPADLVFTAGPLWDEGMDAATLDAAAGMLATPVVAAGPLQGPAGRLAQFRWLRTPGALGDAEVAQLLGERPVFASTAVYEPCGLAALEAAQAGCALVLADTPAFRELWEGAAAFVPPRDPTATADALRRVLAERGRRQFLGAAARERSRRYTVAAMTDALLKAWQPVLAGRTDRDELRGGESAA